jgi:ankyrin repeat protein
MASRFTSRAALTAAVVLAVPLLAHAVMASGDKDKGRDKEKARPAASASPVAAGASRRPTSAQEADLLVNAAMRGDSGSVRTLLARGVDPNVRGSIGKTPLRAATSLGCMMQPSEADGLAVLDALIAAGANVNDVDDFGLGVLLMAAQKCKAAPVRRLLEAGADYEQRSPQGFSPLSMALIVKNYDAAEALVAHGARLSRESMAKIFPEPPPEPAVAALVKRATAAPPKK